MATLAQSRLFRTSIDLSEPVRVQMLELLSSCLADMADLQTHAKHAHWNVKGAQFRPLRELFGQVASNLEQQADDVAERITALGGVAQGTARQVAAASNLRGRKN